MVSPPIPMRCFIDEVTKRWGKDKFPHLEVFELSLLTAEIVETPRRSIALLSPKWSQI